MGIKSKLGRKLREIRLEKGISQEELANRAGFHRTYAENIERGLENPTVEAVQRLADVLNAQTKMLFDYEGDDHVESKLV